ncbi:hypothetical protein KVE90_07300 [Helicobacter pylori]|nr:hypothetical protein KVE90_07300 [Helicobacter pylori]
MKIKAVMLGLAVSGALLFGKDLSLEQREQEIDKIEVNPMDPDYIKMLSKNIMRTNEVVSFNNQQILFASKAFKEQSKELQALQHKVDRMEAELKVLHDQLVDLVAKQH